MRISDWSSYVCSSDLNSLQVGFARSGAANATVGLVAQGEVRRTATLDDTPATRELQRFNQFQGQILREGQALGNVVSAQQVGRAACRERVWQYVEIPGDDG